MSASCRDQPRILEHVLGIQVTYVPQCEGCLEYKRSPKWLAGWVIVVTNSLALGCEGFPGFAGFFYLSDRGLLSDFRNLCADFLVMIISGLSLHSA